MSKLILPSSCPPPKLVAPTRWDKLRHAPLADDRTNEMICIYLELIRLASRVQPPIIYKETMEPFIVYAVRRLNELYHLDIQITLPKPPTPPEDPKPESN
jgi:hypothetical protein